MAHIFFESSACKITRASPLCCAVLVALSACSATDPPPDESLPSGTIGPTGGSWPAPAPGSPGTASPIAATPSAPAQQGSGAPPVPTTGGTATANPWTPTPSAGNPTVPEPGGAPVPTVSGTPGPAPSPVAPTTTSTPTDPAPPAGGQIAGIEFMQRIVGKWTGINSNTPIGIDFPLTVDFAPSSDSFMFGKFELDAQNNVLWGFNVETYDGKDVLAYRNGGYLLGVLRDSRTALVEYDTARGYYRFCAVKEHGLPVDGCNYIDARYTFTAPDRMLFEVTTQSGKPHVHWEAARVETHALPSTFPASLASQGDGSSPWPDAAGLPK